MLLQVTNGARSVLYMHDGNNGVVVTESAPEMGPAARAATGEGGAAFDNATTLAKFPAGSNKY